MTRRTHHAVTPISIERSPRTEQGGAAAEERPRSTFENTYHLPWRVDEAGDVVTAQNEVVIDRFGCTLGEDQIFTHLERIVLCVNACAGLSDKDLREASGLIAWMETQ